MYPANHILQVDAHEALSKYNIKIKNGFEIESTRRFALDETVARVRAVMGVFFRVKKLESHLIGLDRCNDDYYQILDDLQDAKLKLDLEKVAHEVIRLNLL